MLLNGFVVNGIREPILFSFVLDKASGYKIFCELETNHCEKMNKSVWNTITIYSGNDNHKEINFDGEKLTLTLQKIQNWTNKWAFKSFIVIFIVLVVGTDLPHQKITVI